MKKINGMAGRTIVCTLSAAMAHLVCVFFLGGVMAFDPALPAWSPETVFSGTLPVAWCAGASLSMLSFFPGTPRWMLACCCALVIPAVRLWQAIGMVPFPDGLVDFGGWAASMDWLFRFGVVPAGLACLAYVFIHSVAGAALEVDPRN